MNIVAPRPAVQAVLAAIVAATVTACVATPRRPVPTPAAPAPASVRSLVLPTHIKVRVAGRIESVALDDYVLGAVLSEVTPVGETDAAVATIYEVQAIVARTYAVFQAGRHRADGFDLCDTTHCQLYEPARLKTSRFAGAARAAVARTSGRVLAYDSHIAEVVFHSDCGGQTADSAAVWGGQPVPYLRTIVDQLPPETHRAWEFMSTADQLRGALNADPRTEVGRRLDTIEVLSRDSSGRAASIGLRGEHSALVKSDVLRAVVNQALGDRALLSTRFGVTRNGTRYAFAGTGFGHGVGLCQRGGIARARRGDSASDILQTYFPGTKIVQAR